jgi:hypothetical protein
MQVMESELVFALKTKGRFKGLLLVMCIFLVCYAGLFSLLLVSTFQLIDSSSQFPDIQESARHQVILLIITFALLLLAYGLMIGWVIRQLRAPAPAVRISQGGIFLPSERLLITWAEIRELSLATYMGSPYWRIALWHPVEVTARARTTAPLLTRLLVMISLPLVRLFRSSYPMGFFQRVLPIPIPELLAAIHEHFGPQLREHHVLVQEEHQ